MYDLLKKIEREALGLPESERAFLAYKLISSLDGDFLIDLDVKWILEAEHLYQEVKKWKNWGNRDKTHILKTDL